MANSSTEHSKKLRSQTANEWQKKQREAGLKKQIAIFADAAIAEEFNALCKEMGLSKPKALKAMMDFYRANQ